MPRTILLDANVIDQINRGNLRAANALRGMIRIGDSVFVGQQAYMELVFHPQPRDAAANELLLRRMNLRQAPLRTTPARMAGEPPLAGQARALGAEVWSFAEVFRSEPARALAQLGVQVARESYTIPLADAAAPDYRVGFRALGLPPVEISPAGKVVG
jgi:hypothetical protein